MAKVMGSSEPFPLFPPSDRELTLRAQIKTGWSTHSSISYVYHHHGLNDDEIKSIREVVERARAVEHMEEIRIGLLMLKLKQKVKNCRGDGVSTCRICNCDFTRQRSSRPEPIQYCHDCHMVICSRCVFKNPCKVSSGDVHTLCAVCYEERELWMKSGAWLVHSVPAISIPNEDLEEIQQQLNTQVSIGLGRKREDVPLVNPYQLEDSDDDESMQVTSSSIKSRLHFNQSQNHSDTLQPKSSLTLLPSGSKLRSQSVVLEKKSFSDSEDQCTIPQTAVKNRSLSRRSGLSRKGAVLGIDRSRLQQFREGVHSLSVSTSNLQSTSASRYSELTGRNGGSTGTLNDSLPSIKVSSIPINPPPILNSQCPSSRSKSPESDTEPTLKHRIIIHQMHLTSSTDSDSIQVSCDARKQEPVSANIQVEAFGFSSVSSDRAAPVLKKKIDAQPHKAPLEEKEDVRAFMDEFKKINSPPCKPPPQGKFGAGHSLDQGSINERDIKFMVADIAEDEFEKVKRSAVKQEAEVKKMIVPMSSSPKKKVVSSTRSVSVGDVGEFNGKSNSCAEEEELFKKVHVSSSDTKPVAQVRRKLPSLHSIGPPPAGPPPCPPLAKPRPPGPPPPGLPPKNLPQGSLSPAQASMQEEEEEEDPIITKSTVGKTPTRTFRSSLNHRNAFRESRNKRPPPCPNAGDNDKEEQPLHEDEDRKDTGRLRTRSRVIKGRRPQHGGADAANHSLPINASPLIFEEMGDVDGDISQQHPRPRVTLATSQDKIKASAAVLETSSKIDGEVSVTKWKPDGTYGSVQLTLQYSDDNLTVIVHSCKGLRAMDRNGLSDPYVKLFLTPRNKMGPATASFKDFVTAALENSNRTTTASFGLSNSFQGVGSPQTKQQN